MPKPNDKHAKELKRKAKKQAVAKASAGDPWVRVPVTDAQLTCVGNGDLDEYGQVGILVLRTLPDGRQSLASFLVDGGVTGLKDAWGYAKSSLAEFNEMIGQFREDGLPLAPMTPDIARALIAGGARYASEYGFKLPKDWLRWAGILGGVDHWKSADTSVFRPEYAETIGYARRLVGTTPEKFFARPDITFIFPDGEGDPPIDPDEEMTQLEGETLYATPLKDWVEPTRGEYAEVFRLLDKRRNAIVADCVADMAEMAVTPSEGFEDYAVAARAASICVARFGRPPEAFAPPGMPNPMMADLAYFFMRLLEEVLEITTPSVDAMNVLSAACYAIVKLEAAAKKGSLAFEKTMVHPMRRSEPSEDDTGLV